MARSTSTDAIFSPPFMGGEYSVASAFRLDRRRLRFRLLAGRTQAHELVEGGHVRGKIVLRVVGN